MISISCEEFNKLSETGRMAHTLATEFEYIKSCLERGDYDRLFCFGNLSLYGYTNAEVYGLCHDYIPEDRRYDILLRIYTHARSFDGARGHLKEIKKYRPEGCDKELLPLADKSGRITVYRGVFVHDGEKLRPPRLSVSWTVNPSVAHWFASRFPGENERRVYQGTVHLKDVIAYINDRSEEEVILCGGIRNIGEIPVDEQKGAQWRENVRHKGGFG